MWTKRDPFLRDSLIPINSCKNLSLTERDFRCIETLWGVLTTLSMVVVSFVSFFYSENSENVKELLALLCISGLVNLVTTTLKLYRPHYFARLLHVLLIHLICACSLLTLFFSYLYVRQAHLTWVILLGCVVFCCSSFYNVLIDLGIQLEE